MVTRKDIAEQAGVSVSVVSRALNNSGYVESEKKARILQIAEELGYSPNPVAMSLASRRTKQILFYCKDLRNAFNIEPKIRTIVTQNLRFENTKPGQEQAIPFDGLCSPASSAYG